MVPFCPVVDCPLEVEELNQLAQTHDTNKEDAVDYALFLTCKKFINKVCKTAIPNFPQKSYTTFYFMIIKEYLIPTSNYTVHVAEQKPQN